MIKKALVLSLFVVLIFANNCLSQTIDDSVSREQIQKTITFLASNKLRGRVNYTKEQLLATEFIAKEFTSDGLVPFPGFTSFYQPFERIPVGGSNGASLKWNEKEVPDSLFIFLSSGLYPENKDLSDFLVIQASPPIADSVLLFNWQDSSKDIILWVPLSPGQSFSEAIKSILIPQGLPAANILIVGSSEKPATLSLTFSKGYANNTLYNVVGMIPGRSKADETIIFSAHYDHIDASMAILRNGEYHLDAGIMNGANDNASGVTAVLALAHYFAMRKDNERTIIFCLFAGEELGLLGSNAFVKNIKLNSIKAVINIEMIGVTNATGKNAFMVTGSQYSDLVSILQNNLASSGFKVIGQTSDPTLLFERSDNYSFFQEGVVAHSIMCSDDNDRCYHQSCDDVNKIDMSNMTRVIQAITKGSLSLVAGINTPIMRKK